MLKCATYLKRCGGWGCQALARAPFLSPPDPLCTPQARIQSNPHPLPSSTMLALPFCLIRSYSAPPVRYQPRPRRYSTLLGPWAQARPHLACSHPHPPHMAPNAYKEVQRAPGAGFSPFAAPLEAGASLAWVKPDHLYSLPPPQKVKVQKKIAKKKT